MDAGVRSRILHRELDSGLVGCNGLVLGPVVLKDPADVLHERDAGYISQEQRNPEGTIREIKEDAAPADGIVFCAEQVGEQERERQEESQSEGERQNDGPRHGERADLFFLSVVAIERFVRREIERSYSEPHRFEERCRATDDFFLQQGEPFSERCEQLREYRDLCTGFAAFAHGYGEGVR